MAQEDLKILIHIKGNSALVGAHLKDSDPVIEKIAPVASLDEALVAVPGVVARAREKRACQTQL